MPHQARDKLVKRIGEFPVNSEIGTLQGYAYVTPFDAIQRRAYTQADAPQYGEVGHGPWCLGLPNPKVPTGFLPLRNGTPLDEPGRH